MSRYVTPACGCAFFGLTWTVLLAGGRPNRRPSWNGHEGVGKGSHGRRGDDLAVALHGRDLCCRKRRNRVRPHFANLVCFPQPASLMLGLAERSFQRWWEGVGAAAVLLGQRRGLLRRAPRRRGQSGARNGQDNALLGKMNHSGFVTQSLSGKHRRDLHPHASPLNNAASLADAGGIGRSIF